MMKKLHVFPLLCLGIVSFGQIPNFPTPQASSLVIILIIILEVLQMVGAPKGTLSHLYQVLIKNQQTQLNNITTMNHRQDRKMMP